MILAEGFAEADKQPIREIRNDPEPIIPKGTEPGTSKKSAAWP
jgi:hypothetical protein